MNDYLNLVWPLIGILVALLAVRQLRTDASPVVKAVVVGLTANATRNATEYAKAFGFGLSACLAAFYDVFHGLDSTTFAALNFFQLLALLAKVANPFVVAVLAYSTQSGFGARTPTGTTNPPFPQQPPNQ